MVDKVEFMFALLEGSPLFEGLSEAEINGLLECAEVDDFADGQTVVEEGSLGDAIFLLCDGKLSISTCDAQGRKVELAQLDQRGAFFGEISIADPGPRSATVCASGSALLLKLPLEALDAFFAKFSNAQVVILRNIACVLARRLRDSNALVSSLSSS